MENAIDEVMEGTSGEVMKNSEYEFMLSDNDEVGLMENEQDNQLIYSDDFYDDLNKTMDEQMNKVDELINNVIKQRAEFTKLQLEMSQLYNPKYLKEMIARDEEVGDGEEINQHLENIREICKSALESPVNNIKEMVSKNQEDKQ